MTDAMSFNVTCVTPQYRRVLLDIFNGLPWLTRYPPLRDLHFEKVSNLRILNVSTVQKIILDLLKKEFFPPVITLNIGRIACHETPFNNYESMLHNNAVNQNRRLRRQYLFRIAQIYVILVWRWQNLVTKRSGKVVRSQFKVVIAGSSRRQRSDSRLP
jgi:hypothetical protein